MAVLTPVYMRVVSDRKEKKIESSNIFHKGLYSLWMFLGRSTRDGDGVKAPGALEEGQSSNWEGSIIEMW